MPRRSGASLSTYGRKSRVAATISKARTFRQQAAMNRRIVVPRLDAAVRSYIMKKHETKQNIGQAANQQLYHKVDAGSSFVPIWTNLLATTVGAGSAYTRLGDKIHSIGLNFNLWLSNKADRPGVAYRIILVSAESGDLPAATACQDLFFPASGTVPSVLIGNVNTDKYKLHYDKIIQPFSGDYSMESGAATKEHARVHSFNVRTGKDLTYKIDSGTEPAGANWYALFVMAYDQYSSTGADNIASFAAQYTHKFKDI